MCVLGVNVCVLLMYVSLCLWEWHICQRDSYCTWKTKSGAAWSLSSVLLPLDWCIVAILPRIIANSYECESVSEGKVGEENQNKWLSTGFDPICGEICILNMLVFVSECSIQTGFQTLFLSPLSHPNRVPLPGHEGGGEWGSEVNQGSWIYRWQTSLPPWTPVSSIRLWPLGGMGLMLSFCVYIRGYIVVCVCERCSSHHNKRELSPCPVVALSSTAGVGWTRVLDVDVQCHVEDVWKKWLVSDMHTQSHFLFTQGVVLVVISLQNVPLTS